MFLVNIFKAFISGLLTLIYLIGDNWFWIFGIIFFIGCAVLETKEISNEFEDDERQIL